MFSNIDKDTQIQKSQTSTPAVVSKTIIATATTTLVEGKTEPKFAEISLSSTTVEKEVRSYFKDTPELIAVARCESRYRHTDKDGNIIRGVVNNKDVGVMQVNEGYHLETAESLGLDIYSLKGNMAYAKYLYEKQGLSPWISSKPCWGAAVSTASEVALKN